MDEFEAGLSGLQRSFATTLIAINLSSTDVYLEGSHLATQIIQSMKSEPPCAS